VGYVVQTTQRRRVVKDDVGEERPVERPVGAKDGTAERVAQGSPGGLTDGGHGARDRVGVDDRVAALDQSVAHRTLSRAYAASYGDSFHMTTVATPCDTPASCGARGNSVENVRLGTSRNGPVTRGH